jgi:glycosyltransferase involved in cell wall biosynthesis
MGYQVSIIIPTFQRPELLYWGLFSLARQTIPFSFETIVVNDGLPDQSQGICEQYRERLNLKYVFSGSRNLAGGIIWRVPGFAINIGVKQSAGEVLILSCAEMFHLNDTVAKLAAPVQEDPMRIAIPVGKDDGDGFALDMITSQSGYLDPVFFDMLGELDTKLPFLIGVSRKVFCAIGGYDEDLTGIAFDDNDLVDRLAAYGCSYYPTDALAVHLYHPRHVLEVGMSPEWYYNRDLYLSRKNKIKRNLGREWGVL